MGFEVGEANTKSALLSKESLEKFCDNRLAMEGDKRWELVLANC